MLITQSAEASRALLAELCNQLLKSVLFTHSSSLSVTVLSRQCCDRFGNLPVAEVLLHHAIQPRRHQVSCTLQAAGRGVKCHIALDRDGSTEINHTNALGQTVLRKR